MSCAVIGCKEEVSETSVVYLPTDASYLVCESHRDQLDDGDDWIPVSGQGAADDSAEAGLLMGEDLPWRVLAVSSARSDGNRPGLLLKLTLVRGGGTQDFELLVPHGEGGIMLELLRSQFEGR